VSKIKVRESGVWVERNLRVKQHDAFIINTAELGTFRLGDGIPVKPLKVYTGGVWVVI
jgi:hypothetical protein